MKNSTKIDEYSDKNIWFVLEDRAVCVDMWRALGLSCLAVKEVNNVHKS